MGSSNFKQFNPNAANMTNDTDYNSSSYRLNGVVPGQAPSALHNKLFYQVSTMAAAIGQVLADAGKTVTDSNLTSLIADLKDVFIQVPGFPKGYINGPAPVYTSASTVTFKAGLKARNSANTADIELTADVPVSLAISGAGGLDSGAEAANTWYYYYLIRKSGDGTTSIIASTINEAASGSITLPTGYDQKRQLPFAVRNDGSSNIIPFYCVGGWGALRVMYDVSFSDCDLNTLGTTNVVNANTSTSFVSYSCASFIPPISRAGVFQSAVSSASFVRVRPAGASHQGIAVNGNVGVNSGNFECRTDSSRQIEVAELTATGATNRIDVVGYIVTEMQ